jgi:hypothetical protein
MNSLRFVREMLNPLRESRGVAMAEMARTVNTEQIKKRISQELGMCRRIGGRNIVASSL